MRPFTVRLQSQLHLTWLDPCSNQARRVLQERAQNPEALQPNAYGKTPLPDVMAAVTTSFDARVEERLREHAAFVKSKGLYQLPGAHFAINGKLLAFSGDPMVRISHYALNPIAVSGCAAALSKTAHVSGYSISTVSGYSISMHLGGSAVPM